MAELLVRPNGSRRMLGDFLGFDPFRTLTANVGFEITKNENGYVAELPVAGYAPENIDITFEDRLLTVTGKNERRNFTQTLLLPEEIDGEAIGAKVEHGMLTISLNVHPKAPPRKITIKIADE